MPRDSASKDAKRQAYRAAIKQEMVTITVQPRRPGRPETYTVERGLLVCEKMVEFGSLSEACRRCDGLPDATTVYSWAFRHPEFDRGFTRAWEALGLRWADEIVDIADNEDLDPNARRVKIDARKWVLSKLASRRFGDKLQVAGDPENPIHVLHQSVSLDALSAVQLDAIERFARDMLTASDAEVVEEQAK